MKKLTSNQIRDIWLNFFKDKNHFIEPSSSLVPFNDPSLLWINAGVAALKKYFDGTLEPRHRRIANAQKCIRTNDIDNVGYTSRHHTFFEMLGNFSIGDYFRDEVIPWAVELITSEKYYGLDKEKIYITYYPDDKDTYNLWLKCGIDKSHLIPCESNFWEIGEGPCGPDTEIYYDRGEKYDPKKLGLKLLIEEIENDRYIELWNIVFSQFNSEPGKKREDYKLLPQKNIDTGAGLERFACILQEAETNFETDLFMPYIKEIEKKSNKKYEGSNKVAFNVIADHIRSLTFALSDGASFSNDGRGYVLKRLVRRASRYASSLGLKDNSLSELVPIVVKNMSHFYPYLTKHQEKVMKMISNEEMKFSSTLKSGEKILESYLKQDGDTLSGEKAFKLSDTYGFPFELTKEIVLSLGKKIDEKGYNKILEESKEKARNSRDNKSSFANQNKDLLEFKSKSTFIYDDKIVKSKIIGLFQNGKRVETIDDEGDVIFEETNFYAEMGGEVADVGYIKNEKCECEVTSVVKANHGQHLIHVKVLYGSINVGDIFDQMPDFEARTFIRKNHSATHLLQKALNEVLSDDISQQGAYYDQYGLRFDFNYNQKISSDQLEEIEERVNEKIREGLKVKAEIMKKEEAFKKQGLVHLFNEKYGDEVRVLSMGNYSIELCGGLHVSNTNDINLFVIKSEFSVSSGIRRIEATTSLNAYLYLKEQQKMINESAEILKLNSPKNVRSKLFSMLEMNSSQLNEIKRLQEELTNYMIGSLESKFEKVNGVSLLIYQDKNLTHQQLDSLAHKLIDKHSSLVAFIVSKNDVKYDLVCASSVNNIKAGQVIKEVAPILSGSGGGRDDVAFGGATDISKYSQIKDKIIKTFIK